METVAIKFIKGQLPIIDTAQFVENLYYYFRHYLYFEKTLFYGASYSNYNFVDRFRFIGSFSYLLKRMKIDNEVFIGTKRYMGLIDSVVLLDEITPGIKIKHNGGSRYIYYPHKSSVLEDGDFNMEGTKVYAILQNPGVTDPEIFSCTIPVSDKVNNTQNVVMKVGFSPGNDNKLIIANKYTSCGITKTRLRNWIVNPEDYYPNEFEYIQKLKKFRQSDYSKMDKILAEMDDNKRGFMETRGEIFNLWLEGNYSISEYELDTLIIDQPGRFSDSMALVFSYKFSTSGLIKKAGNYLILDMGKLMGGNVDFDIDERDRASDIFMDGPRQFIWDIEVEIPDGYYVEKTENLEFEVENITGSFISTLSYDPDFVRVSISKAYNHNYEAVENWPMMLVFLDAANDFYGKKLVFKEK
ncbi:MAG: hypothetical protein DRJ05_16290 [Bacteroidetes bacterium]|nr:MAG: hypothetical protein DRJ05_16290 [Bacteroidota bacterium]